MALRILALALPAAGVSYIVSRAPYNSVESWRDMQLRWDREEDEERDLQRAEWAARAAQTCACTCKCTMCSTHGRAICINNNKPKSD